MSERHRIPIKDPRVKRLAELAGELLMASRDNGKSSLTLRHFMEETAHEMADLVIQLDTETPP